MFVGFAPWTLHQLTALRSDESWRTRWRPALQESPIGRPQRLAKAPYTSANLISKVYELYSFERLTGKAVHQFKGVIELGAGYGLLVPTLSRLGFTGSYLAWDLPEFLALQRYYTRSLVEQIEFLPVYTSGLKALQNASVVLPGPVLLIATWSLSEMPLDLRAQIETVLPPVDACLIAYQEEFRGIDNRAYFKKWSESRPDFKWVSEVIPETTSNRLLVGRR